MTPIIAPIGEIINSLYGAIRLAAGKKDGLDYFNFSKKGFWQSFTAAIIIAPLFILLLSVKYKVSDNDINVIRFAFIYSIAYVIGWVAFPLIVNYITVMIGRGQKFIHYIVVYNWASVPQNIFYLPFAISVEAQILQGTTANATGLFLLSLVFLYTYFITKVALKISSGIAAGIVVFDLILNIIISAITQRTVHMI